MARIVIGGNFTSVNGFSSSHLARLDADGSLAADNLEGTDDYVQTVLVQPDGRILVGGKFNQVGAPHHGLARLNRDGSVDAGFTANTNQRVETLAHRLGRDDPDRSAQVLTSWPPSTGAPSPSPGTPATWERPSRA